MPVLPGSDALPNDTHLGEYEILRVLGVGGFGIVYLATDHALQRQVAIKEYMPSSLAGRSGGAQVSLRSSGHAETYMIGLRSFVNEARLLARFDHPALVKVYRFWEQNGTAYMVMPFYEGLTLKDVRARLGRPPSEAWLRGVLGPVMAALDALHAEQVYHRDVSPDNILLLGPQGEGAPVLLDLGAARRVIGDKTQSLTAILKPSYAPIEQYADVQNLKQGPWTDLYALASVVYFCIAGQPPSPATSRTVHDELRPLRAVAQAVASTFGERYSQNFVDAVDWALAVRPGDRPQSVQAFAHALDHGRPASGYEVTEVMPRDSGDETRRITPLMAAAAAQAAPAGTPAPDVPPPMTPPPSRSAAAPAPRDAAARPQPAAPAAADSRDAPASAGRRGGRVVAFGAAAVVLAALGAGAGWLLGERQAEPAAPAQVPVAAAVPPPTLAVSAAPAPAPVTDTAAATKDAARDNISPPADATRPQAQETPAQTVEAVRESAVAAARASAAAASRREAARRARALEAARESTPAPAPAPSVAQAPAPAPDEPTTPRQACGRRVFIALFNCMKEQCDKPQWAQHPQCRKLHEMEAARQRGDVN
ncbi:MAG: serine/threonine protein kinase [Betaproteobacteria bacterium]|nr:serine/threonine protein kinase [Betaproteobacteria bacterium]